MFRTFFKLAALAAAFALPAQPQSGPGDRTPEQVVQHHWTVFNQRDLDATMSDYADDAIFLTSTQAVQGKDALRHLFESFLSTHSGPTPQFDLKISVQGDVAYEHWVSNPGKPDSMEGIDAFLVRQGKIQVHAVMEYHPAAKQ